MMRLAASTRSQLPVLEATLRQWRLNGIGDLEPEAGHRRRVEREATRLLSLVTVLREDMSRTGERLNAVNAVLPFIEVTRSPIAGTEAKSAAVESLGRIVDAMLETDEGAVEALSAVTEAVLECRFEQTDSGADEVAMMWLLEALGKCSDLKSVGKLLSGELLFRVIETLFDGCTVPFNTDTTRAIALKLTTRLLHDLFSVAPFGPTETEGEQVTAPTTFAARRAFQFLVEMADPEHVQTAHVIGSWGRFVALRLLVEATSAAVIDTESSSELRIMRDPFMEAIVKDDLMRTIIQKAQTVGSSTISNRALDDPQRLMIISESLRLANILLSNSYSRRELTTQFECFFNAVYFRVLEKSAVRKIARPDEAVLVIESLCDLLANPAILCDSFAAFDLHLQSTDVFENTFKLFSRLAFPHQLSVPALDGFRLLSLRGLLVSLRALTIGKDPESSEEATWKEEERHARELKARKHALHRCADAFNTKPKHGVQALMDEGVLSNPPDPLVLASFLRNTPTLDKVAIGQFLGEDGELNRAVLRAFTETFDVRNRTLVASLRMFLECFRLPKESQQIDRIVQVFADIAMAQSTDATYFPTVDACYILCFAIIMLNTDLHNPNIRPEKKMTLNQFISTNRNYGAEVSKGVELPVEFLTAVYSDIAKREINTMKEGTGITAEISRDRWHDMLARARDAKLKPSVSFGYKRCMFESIWKQALAAVSVMFDSGQAAEQPDALHSALDGFLTLAKAAARFKCLDAFDSVVAALCKFTSLLTYGVAQIDLVENSRAFNQAVRDFGNHHKGQMAAMSVFALSRRFGSETRRAWKHVLWCILRMNDLKLLPDSFRSEDLAMLDVSARSLFHRKMRDNITRAYDARAKTPLGHAPTSTTTRGLSSEASSSSGATGWGFTSWLFGGDEEDAKNAQQQRLENDDEYRALMSALKVADSFCSLERTSSTFSSPKTSRPSSPRGGPDESHHHLHHHHHKRLESVDVLEEGDAEDIFSRVEDVPVPSSQYAAECVRSCRPFTVIQDSRLLSDEALSCLVEALFSALGMTTIKDDSTLKDDLDLGIDTLSPPSSGSRLIAVHLLAELTLRNSHRLDIIATRVCNGLFEILETQEAPSFLQELACVGLLRIATGLFPLQPNQFVFTFQRLVEFFPKTPGLDFLVGRTVLDLISRPGDDSFWFTDSDGRRLPRCGWDALFSLEEALCAANPTSAAFAFDALKLIATTCSVDSASSSLVECARCAASFTLVKWPAGEHAAREVAALDLVYSLVESSKSVRDTPGFVSDTFIPILHELLGIAAQSEIVSPISKKRALLLVQRACLNAGPTEHFASEDWLLILDRVIFSACSNALRNIEGGISSPLVRGSESMPLVAACELLAKYLLAFAARLASLESFPERWVEVLQYLERFKQAGLVRASGGDADGNVLSETVTELLKNLLLFLSAEGILSPTARVVATGQPLVEGEVIPPPNSPSSLLWEMSWTVLDRSPGLRSELFPVDDAIDLRETPTIEILTQEQQAVRQVEETKLQAAESEPREEAEGEVDAVGHKREDNLEEPESQGIAGYQVEEAPELEEIAIEGYQVEKEPEPEEIAEEGYQVEEELEPKEQNGAVENIKAPEVEMEAEVNEIIEEEADPHLKEITEEETAEELEEREDAVLVSSEDAVEPTVTKAEKLD